MECSSIPARSFAGEGSRQSNLPNFNENLSEFRDNVQKMEKITGIWRMFWTKICEKFWNFLKPIELSILQFIISFAYFTVKRRWWSWRRRRRERRRWQRKSTQFSSEPKSWVGNSSVSQQEQKRSRSRAREPWLLSANESLQILFRKICRIHWLQQTDFRQFSGLNSIELYSEF